MKRETISVCGRAICPSAITMALMLVGCAVDTDSYDSPNPDGRLASQASMRSGAAMKVEGVAARLPDPGSEFRSGSVSGQELTQKSDCSVTRTDTGGYATIGTGNFGNWGCADYCSAGSYALTVALRSEVAQGSGDDTALNAIKLGCYYYRTGQYAGFVTSSEGPFGSGPAGNNYYNATWTVQPFNVDNYFVGGRMKMERYWGEGADDSIANQVGLYQNYGGEIIPDVNASWGDWNAQQGWGWWCPAGQAVCGVQTRVEPYGGSGYDDTSLNGIRLLCCTVQ